MCVKVAIGMKALVIIVSLGGLLAAMFHDVELFPGHTQPVITQPPDITNEWAALAYSSDADTRDDALQAVKEHQMTARHADDNTARVALYEASQMSLRLREKKVLLNFNLVCHWGIRGVIPDIKSPVNVWGNREGEDIMNTYREMRKTIVLVGVITLIVLLMQNLFIMLGPVPDSPEIARAKASVLVKDAEARLQFEWLKQTVFVGIASLFSGVILVSFSLWTATRLLWKSKSSPTETS